MQVHVSRDAAPSVATGALVVPAFAGSGVDGVTAEVDRVLGGAIADVLASGEIAGKSGETSLIHAKDAPFRRVLVVGLGEREKLSAGALAKYAGAAVRALGKRGVQRIALALPPGVDARLAGSFVAEGAISATLDTTIYRTEADKPVVTSDVTVLAGDYDPAALEAGTARGTILGEAVNAARRMALTPGNDMTPTHLANRAKELAADAGLEYDVLDEARMAEKGMGALLGVSRGSDEPATLSVLTYRGDPSSNETLALVGKGLTFDSGGISIKPAENMHEMKYDMSGGAGVAAALWAIGKLRPKLNVIGLIPSSENLPGGRAIKPGDIVRAMSGKTVEVINTDAEGRLILADAICYARELGATKIVDAATLTGACVIALGHAASGTMSNDDAFAERFLRAVADSGERYWRLPLYADYDEAIKSEIADLKNSAGRPGGAETAGAFLKAFVGDVPWIHLDVAGTAYVPNEAPHMAKGPTGTPVRAFVTIAEELAANGFSTNGVASHARAAVA
ncbi:MAG: leucyl aminopeptidase [Candidatus Eremiobacteraeota bacterium]|nr:leucyl aminopeptidase [Candidatus Eremiobacteraeota bacterium]